jgi:hypothetical protein
MLDTGHIVASGAQYDRLTLVSQLGKLMESLSWTCLSFGYVARAIAFCIQLRQPSLKKRKEEVGRTVYSSRVPNGLL